MPEYQPIIGLEIHIELKTDSKMFCACANQPDAEQPNRHTCPICLGHPGTLPFLNEQAVKLGCLLSLALGCHINQTCKFDRKNYFYPDLPKGYQISQYDLPLAVGGALKIGPNREIPLTRLHLEEDTGKINRGETWLIDYNRAGVPLLELVTEPLIHSAAEAKIFCQKLRQILRYLAVSDADMEKGLMRCEANVSLQVAGSWQYQDGHIEPIGQEPLNPKVEVKNINSFKALEAAINYEINRQNEVLTGGRSLRSETRGWDDASKTTKAQRLKETSADYRYFPEPDLPPLNLSDDFLKTVRQLIIELPADKTNRFREEYGLPDDDIEQLIADQAKADYFEQVVSELRAWIIAGGDDWSRQNKKLAKLSANWLNSEFAKLSKEQSERTKVSPENFAELLKLIYGQRINSSAGQTILAEMFATAANPTQLMRRLGLEQLDDQAILNDLIEQALSKYPQQATELKSGKIALLKFFVGQVMAASGGKANPQLVETALRQLLN